MSSVKLAGVEKRYGALVTLDGIDLAIGPGEFVTLLGASGSGKTTCLRIVAGFIHPDAGRVMFDDADVTRVAAHRRDTAMVFQHYALFPHLTVRENVAFGLRLRRCRASEIDARVKAALELVQLAELSARYPSQLSGGQKQRVALARAVVIRPKVLLLDEPLGALDLKLREELQVEIKRVQRTVGITTLFVTHDQNEALSMSDRIALMRNGRILQIASPMDLYEKPVDRYVASFVGKSNFMRVKMVERDTAGCCVVSTPDGRTFKAAEGGASIAPGSACLASFRPEAVQAGDHLANQLQAVVEKSTYVGNSWTLQCLAGHESLTVMAPSGSPPPPGGSTITVCWDPARMRLLADAPDGETQGATGPDNHSSS